MPVVIAMLRGVNVGGHNKIKMEALRALCEAVELRGVRTHIQSGNVVFRSEESDLLKLARKLEDELEKAFGFRPAVILRTSSELKKVLARNPFASREGIDPSRLLVSFLARDPGQKIRDQVAAMQAAPEELRIAGREMYIYYPDGMARPKLSMATIERVLKIPMTGRNLNTVTKLLAMAEEIESS